MHYVFGFLGNSRFQRLFVVAIFFAASSLVWGEGSAVATTSDEPRELSGFIIAAIIFNISMATIILLLLRKEWNKHKRASKLVLNHKSEGR